MFVSISQVIGCEDRLRNDLYCVEWGVKLYSNFNSNSVQFMRREPSFMPAIAVARTEFSRSLVCMCLCVFCRRAGATVPACQLVVDFVNRPGHPLRSRALHALRARSAPPLPGFHCPLSRRGRVSCTLLRSASCRVYMSSTELFDCVPSWSISLIPQELRYGRRVPIGAWPRSAGVV